MAEYIERKRLEESFDNADPDVCESDLDGHSDWGFGRENIRDVIRSVPAALHDVDRQRLAVSPGTATLDAVPVVRCKECVQYDMGVCLKIYSDGNAHPEAWQRRRPEDFCSYGERKEGAEC